MDKGPYEWVRHPGYAANVVAAVAYGVLVSTSYVFPLFSFLLFLGIYAYRIAWEEKMLKTIIGKPYLDYMKKVPYRLAPGLF